MSMNVGAKSTDRGKRSSPSQKNKSATSTNFTKTETSKRGSNPSSVSTLDKYLIKGPAAALKTNNNNASNTKNKRTAKGEFERKAGDSNGSVNVSKTTEPGVTKETTPEPDIIIVDDSPSDLDASSATKTNGSKEEKLSASDPDTKNANGKGEAHSETSADTQVQPKPCEPSVDSSEHKSTPDDGNSTDEVQSEVEAETQDNDLHSEEDAGAFVDYKEADFNTDSDLDRSETDSRAPETEGGKSVRASGSKKKTAGMGGFFSRYRRRQENCEGSSSEEDSDRPWRSTSTSREQRTRPYPKRLPRFPLKKQWSDRDTQEYRAGYPNKKDNKNLNFNIQFYQGKIRSKPDGAFIDDFHKDWWRNHDRLESHHGYIQWLFPIRESGMNFQAQELQLHEAQAIRSDTRAMERFRKSYEMMLYFYGIRLVDKRTGRVDRADNWRPRFQHLNHSMHNYLRITRILKCLGELGLEHYKPPLLEFLLREASGSGPLSRTLDSCYNYWIGTVRDDQERARLTRVAERGWTAGSSSSSISIRE